MDKKMEIELKPCPHCGGREIRVFDKYYSGAIARAYYVICFDCWMKGPELSGNEAAAEAWNALPRALTWSSEPPKVPGWYFTRRNRPGKPLRVMYVKREKKYDHRVKEWRYFMTLANIKSEDGRIIEDLNQPDRLWAGPIPEPGKLQNDQVQESGQDRITPEEMLGVFRELRECREKLRVYEQQEILFRKNGEI